MKLALSLTMNNSGGVVVPSRLLFYAILTFKSMCARIITK